MYTLYFSPGACSLAVHTILNHLHISPTLVLANSVEQFNQINPANMVPVLKSKDTYLTEGAAIILYLLEQHSNTLLPSHGDARQNAIENLMLANATVHPAYGRLFFIEHHVPAGPQKSDLLTAAQTAINKLWDVVESKIGEGPFFGGNSVSPADILLAVYSRWGGLFPVNIQIGKKAQLMIDHVLASDAFQHALASENEEHQSHVKQN